MRRDRARLSAAAERIQADLRLTTQRPWTCSVADDYTLHVTDGARNDQVLLEADVEDEEWFVPAGASPADVADGLDADADELLASEVVEVMGALGLTWPVCPDHGRVLGACSGWWYCDGEPGHDVAAVGSLQGFSPPPATTP